MKILITGANGQLGKDFINIVKDDTVIATDINTLDITDENAVMSIFEKERPDIVYHFAAYTAVDRAQDEEEICTKVNDVGSKNIATACKTIGATLVYISTDYVFDGTKVGEYKVDDEPNPINVYGKTKLAGEIYSRELEKHFIVRISWVFGTQGNNFLYTMDRLAKTHDELSIVSDQIGSPTFTEDVASYLYELRNRDDFGTYHVTNEGVCSWFDFAEYFFKAKKIDIKLNKILTKDYKTKAKRPLNSVLDKSGNFRKLPTWQDAVDRFVRKMEDR